jgi:pre-mRNA-splicing factor ATP-dependent RNA helicase DHX15/PRP43
MSVKRTIQLDKHDKKWTVKNFLSGRWLSEVENIRGQLQRIMERHSLELVSLKDPPKICRAIRRVLCCGYFMQAAHKTNGTGKYLTIKDNQVVNLHPSCGLGPDNLPEWVIFDELTVTTSPYIRTVTSIKAKWYVPYVFIPLLTPSYSLIMYNIDLGY